MTELEQLRKEVNELRERVAVLERKPQLVHMLPTPQPYQQPYTTPPAQWPRNPNEITCGMSNATAEQLRAKS